MKSIWQTRNADEIYYINTSDYNPDFPLLRVQAFCHSRLFPQWQTRSQQRPYLQISLILSGSEAFTSPETGQVNHAAGTFKISDLNSLLAGYKRNATQTLERYFIIMENTRLLQTILEHLFPGGMPLFTATDLPRLAKCFEAVRELLKKRQIDDIKLSACAFQLLQEAARQHPRRRLPEALSNALLYIANHYCDKHLTRERIAAAVGVSTATLQRMFRQYNQGSIARYITLMRLQKAAHLLRNSALSVAVIAEKCGYSYAYYLAREFKKVYHCPPLIYRKMPAEPAEKIISPV